MSSLYESMWPAFYAEVSEQLEELESRLVSVDSASADIAQIFRLFHTIKSSAAMMEFTAMEQLAHVAEDLLDLVRHGSVALNDGLCDLTSRIAARLRAQLQQADSRQGKPDQDPALYQEASALLRTLSPANSVTMTADTTISTAVETETEERQAFSSFAAAARTALPACGDWLRGQRKSPPRTLAAMINAARDASLPAIAALADQACQAELPQRWWLFADLLHRLDTLRLLGGEDFGIPELAAKLRAQLASDIHRRIDTLQEQIPALTDDTLHRLASEIGQLAALCWLVDYRSLALLLRFLRQVLLDASRGKLLLDENGWQLASLALHLGLEINPQEAEDVGFVDVCGRALTSLQAQVQATADRDDSEAVRRALTGQYDLPYSLIASLHQAALHDLLDACQKQLPLFDIEVDMDGPDVQRDGFLGVISQHGRLISNRTVFTSDRPGDRDAEETRLSIIAACLQDPEVMRHDLLAFHSERFHLSVTEIRYLHGPAETLSVADSAAAETLPEPAIASAEASLTNRVTATEMVRVSSDGLDRFVTRVGELVLLRNRIDHILRNEDGEKTILQLGALTRQIARRETLDEDSLQALARQLDTLLGQIDQLRDTDDQLQQSLSQLQNEALDLRVVPIDMVFRRMPVLVKQLSRQLGKPAELHIAGADTRIDKSMVDILSEPLIHMLRNALDHGIESPQQRQLVGKSATAHLTLRASNAGGTLQIELSDDGRGLDQQRIVEQAIQHGILTATEAHSMSDNDIQALIFRAGFSTASTITETSGRGVGMDVVKTRIDQLGGTIAVRSTPGKGCQITLTMPVSAAIQGIALFQHDGVIYGIAERNLGEIIAISRTDVQAVQGQAVMLHRGHTLPLYSLSHLFQRSARGHGRDNDIPVLLVGDGRRRIGLMVDEIYGRQEIFVRECHPDIAALPGVAGASVLGNGQPVLILDAGELIDLAAQRAQSLRGLMEAS